MSLLPSLTNRCISPPVTHQQVYLPSCHSLTGVYLLPSTGVVEGKARYLTRYPVSADVTDVLDPNTPDYDADVKIPGRYFW